MANPSTMSPSQMRTAHVRRTEGYVWYWIAAFVVAALLVFFVMARNNQTIQTLDLPEATTAPATAPIAPDNRRMNE